MKALFVFFLRLYRACISPALGHCCRFYPSCSVYAEEAITKKGAIAGARLAFKRLFKCHPFHPGGVDLLEP